MEAFKLHRKYLRFNLFILYLSLFVITISFTLNLIECKIVEGSLQSSRSRFIFLARFCFFADTSATLKYSLAFPTSYCEKDQDDNYPEGCQDLVLYYDEKYQWEHVYKNDDLTCEEKISTDLLHPSQIVSLRPGSSYQTGEEDSYRFFTSGCWLRRIPPINSSTEIKCESERYFISRRDRWWYVALANCQSKKGLRLSDFHFEFLNGDSYLRHFSADEWYIMEMNIVSFLLFLILIIITCVFAATLNKLQLHHSTFKMFSVSLLLKTISIFFYVGVYIYYQRGYESITGKNFGLCFSIFSEIIFMFLILLLSKGFSITRAKLRKAGSIKLTIFMSLFASFYLAAFIYHCYIFDPGDVLYFYESPPGYVTISLKYVSWFMMTYGVYFTVKHYPEKLKFYLRFYLFYSAWVVIAPTCAIFSIFVLEAHYRMKVVYGIEIFLSFLSFAYFLFLTRPTKANKNFPFHIKTNQVAALETTKTGDFPHDESNNSDTSISSQETPVTNFTDVFCVENTLPSENASSLQTEIT